MLVATFGPTSKWVGKTISGDGSVFAVEDHGPITASDIMEHDRQGHLMWATDGVQKWVRSLVRQPAPPPPTRPPVPEPAAALLTDLPGVAGAAEPLPEVEAGREPAEAVADVPEAVADKPMVTEGAGNRPEAEATGHAEAPAEAAPAEERPADVPPAPPSLERYSSGFPRDAAVGILRADRSVEWVFETGEPVPTPRRRVSYVTVADLQTASGQALRVPVVRGSGRVRYSVVGAAVIAADEISADLPLGSKVVLGIKLDDEYRIVVSAYLPATKDVWDDALKLGYAEAFPDERPAAEEKHITPSVAAGAEGAEVMAAPAEDEQVPAEESGMVPGPAAPAVESAESPVVPVESSEPEAPAPPAADEETAVAAETQAASNEEQGFLTAPTTLFFDLEPSPESAAELAYASAVESAPGVDSPIAPAPPPGPEVDSDRIDLAGRRAGIEPPADDAQTAETAAAAAYPDLDLDPTASARGRRPSDGATDAEILQRARICLLANQFEEAAHEVGRLGGSETLLAEALDVLARVRLHQGHLDVAKSLWIQADEINPGVKRYAEGLELVAEARGRGYDDGLRRRRTIAIMAVLLVTVLVVIVLGVYACHGSGPASTSAGGSPSPTVTAPSTPGAVRENTQPPSFPVRVRGTSVQATRTAAVLTFEQGLFASDGTDISGPGQTVLLWLGDRLETHTQDLLVRVIGHTDSRPIRGPGRYVDNVELGMARAIAVINFLRRKAGVPYVLLSAATVGATKPLASNATERGRARNRTVVIEIAETVH